jgi:hypothetical protein
MDHAVFAASLAHAHALLTGGSPAAAAAPLASALQAHLASLAPPPALHPQPRLEQRSTVSRAELRRLRAAAASKAASWGSDEITKSACARLWASPTAKPACAASAMRSGLGSATATAWPARLRCPAMGKPILPTPKK